MQRMSWSSILIVLMFEGLVYSYPSGAPSGACISLTPNHGGSSQSTALPYTLDLSPFDLYSDDNSYYEPGSTYELTLSGGTFRGFLLQARLMADDTTLVGSFSDITTGTRLSSCSPSNSSITHSGNNDKMFITGTWTAPPRGTGPIRFRFAVVQQFSTYWADVMSSVVYESGVFMLFDGGILANHSLVVRSQIGEDEDGITCTSENVDCCSSTDTSIGWFSPSGTAVYEGADGAETLYNMRGVGFVRLNRITGGTSALYWCDIPDYSGTIQRFYVGLYIGTLLSGTFTTVTITFEIQTELTADPPQFALVCRTEGGPASTITWERDGVTIQDDNNHSTSQIVVNAESAVYHNVLVVTERQGGVYRCTAMNSKTEHSDTITVEVGTDPTNVVAIQQSLSAVSITVTWDLPSSPTPTGSAFLVLYETAESNNSISVDFCTECETVITGVMAGTTYSISVVTLSEHLPSNVVGPVNVTLATGCIELGYTSGCCVSDTENTCTLDISGTENDCFCDEQCYSLENCCQDILLSCPPPGNANLCALFRGYDCDPNAQCLSAGNQENNSASYQCVCSEGYIGDGNTTCLGASVEVNPPAILATNGSSGLTITCVAPFFSDGSHYWILIEDELNTTVATGGVFELPQVVFDGEDQGARYQCIVETQYGAIFSDIVKVVVSPQGGVNIEPSMATVERGETITLACSSLGGPGNTFTWTQLSTGLQVSSEESLTVSVSSGADGGVYQCLVENDAGNDTADATVIVPPVLEVSPASITAQLGSNLTLHCTANGFPTPIIEWVHFGMVLRERGGIEVDAEVINSTVISTLSITDVQTENYGLYTCRANTTQDSQPATVSFSGTVSLEECDVIYDLTESSNNLTVGSTRTVCFQCLYSGSVGTGTQWTLDSEPISNSFGTTAIGVLVIFTAVQVFDVDTSSTILCTGPSTYTYSITIRALEAPIIPEAIDVRENEDISVTCDSSGSIPVTSHTWTDAGGIVVSTDAELTFLDAMRTQAGVYTCTIRDDIGGTASANTTINVLSIPSILDFTPSPHFVFIGEQLRLFCAYSGIPVPDIDWLVNSSAINIGPDVSVTSNATHSMLTVESVADTNDGTYTCNVINSVGSDQASIIVNILLTPPPPMITIRATGSNIAGQTYTLLCLADLIEGASVTTDVEWIGADGTLITDGGGISIGDLMMEGVGVSRNLTFDSLLASQAGEYTCRASFPEPDSPAHDIASNLTTIVTVQIPTPSVSIAVPPQTIHEGTSIKLTCAATVDATVDTDIRAIFEWAFEGSSNFTESRFSISGTITPSLPFESVLDFNPISLRDSGEYSCSVMIEGLTQHVGAGEGDTNTEVIITEIPSPDVEIMDSGDSVAGRILSLTCSVTTVENLVTPPHVEFINAFGDELLMQKDIHIGSPITEGMVTTLMLEFSPLTTSLGGFYICRATIDIPQAAIVNVSSVSVVEVTVTIPSPSVLVVPGNESMAPYAAMEYSLVCQISVNTTHVDTGTMALVVWMNSEGQLMSNSRITVSETLAGDGSYNSTLAFSPLSLVDHGDFVCSVIITLNTAASFVEPSSTRTDNYTITVMAPLTPNVTFTIHGFVVAGEVLQLMCISEFPRDLFTLPSLSIIDKNAVELQINLTILEGLIQGTVLLAPLLTSHNGLYTCVSSYDFPEAGLTDLTLYSTRQSTTVTVSIPVPRLIFTTEPNATYIGTETYLNCTVQLAAAVDSVVQVNVSLARKMNDSSDSDVEEVTTSLSDNTYQSSIVFSPLVGEDEGEYMCSATVEPKGAHIIGTTVEGLYSLIPLDTVAPEVVIAPQQPTTLGTNVSLLCIVTLLEDLLYLPLIEWVQLPDTAMADNDISSTGNIYWRKIEFSPLLESHGGLYICSARLTFPNKSLSHLSSTQNYSLVVQAPIPTAVIMQDPIRNLIEGSPVSLSCIAMVPSPNGITFAVSIRWTDADMSQVGNTSDGRIVVGAIVEKQPNNYLSVLTIAAVDAELDSTYRCVTDVILPEQSEFVTAQPGIRNISLIILGPPADFVVVAMAQTSLSFTWGLPLTTGPVIEYVLECSTAVTGIEDPLPLNTTEQSAVLVSLSPGILYSCSLTALTGTDTPPSATLTATTAESAPTGPPLNFMAVSAGARSITFMWEAPESRLQNGIILSYTIFCDPRPSSQLAPVDEAGSATLSGFSPLTSYKCSVSARNSAGNGPLTYDDVTTGDDTILFQLKLLGVQDCVAWKAQGNVVKLADIVSVIVDNINKRCDCSFIQDNIMNGVFQCFGSSADSVTYRAHLLGLADINSTTLVAYVAEWVATGQTVLLQNVHFLLDRNCEDEVLINEFSDPECSQAKSESSQPLNTGTAAGITAAAILVAMLLVGFVIVLVVFLRRRHHAKVTLRTLKRIVSQNTQGGGNTILLRSHRESTTSVNSNEMVFNEHHQSSTFVTNPHYAALNDSVTDNPMYSNPAAAPELAKQKTPLPPLPTLYEELDGYALPSTVATKHSSTTCYPTDYLQPVSPTDAVGDAAEMKKVKSLAPLKSSTVFSNRYSGIYEDPGYATLPQQKPVVSEASKKKRADKETAREGEGSEKNTSGAAVVVGEYKLPSPQKITIPE